MRSNFFWTANRMIWAWVVATLAGIAVLVIVAGALNVLPIVVFGVSVLVAPVSLIVPLKRMLTRQIDQVVEHASVLRPGAVVIPAAALVWTRADREGVGLQMAGRNASGGSPVAVTVLADRVEVWSGRVEPEPRWSVSRADLMVVVDEVRVGMSNVWDVVRLGDGRHDVLVSPRYSPRPNEAGKDIDRVLAELGLDPSRVRRPEPMPAVSRKTVRLVRPFYLPLAGGGVTDLPDRLRKRLVRAGRKVTAVQVRDLLAGGWREMVVGAHLALALPADDVRDAVLAAMARSRGGDTGLPLSVVAVLLAGPTAVEAMNGRLDPPAGRHRDDDLLQIVAAAVSHAGGAPGQAPPPWAVEAFEDMLAAALDLQRDFANARA
ncbi:hypothetical protein [Myceligenerans xiligouense]|uniref:Uncharacterized protein n=1 Tax=Myceligenerans xiligouense TaxID=253184 RepID=A0A3N4Z6I7_9MICO|nr:hypothetical protein [Myceligenerans xiligouense]RPF21438.1 hypothetical protein EDD34_2066 [Myceligenerans xiligouense]